MAIDFDAPHDEADPWGYETHWYEKRRRALIAALLPRETLGQVLEIGCSTGLITQLLAPRARHVLAVDVSSKAVSLARQRLQGLAQVEIVQADITQDWSARSFDHILLCDVAYYLSEAQLGQLARNIRIQASADCVLLLAHWRHPFAQVITSAQAAHDLLGDVTGFHRLAGYQDEDLLIDVLSASSTSVAQKDGLL
jgi:2-polyprenyl-3-methyl-5-hydroxy-6-metoxy-1,4-benzoquinol methylase